jgi:glycosyltransferase involved in cell wall biosynthesis
VFLAAFTSPIAYSDPWIASFEERVAALTAGERRIAYFQEGPNTSTFRYRVFNMIEALAAVPNSEISASWFTFDDLGRMEKFIDRADALVICRTRYTAAVNRMVARAKARGLPVLFDIDDLMFDPDYVHLVIDTLDQDLEVLEHWDHWFAEVGRLGATLRLCDGAIVTNQFLAERVTNYAPWIQPRVVPNFLNRSQSALSRRLFEAKRSSGFARNGKQCVGYFSGTPSHNRDFEIVAGALDQLLDDDPRLMVRVVGFLEPKGALFRHWDSVELYPLQDFLNLQRLIAEVEVNLVPVQDNVFTNCKSELKYFEAAIVGTISVASPIFTFRAAIRDGENGYLASAHEWEAKIRAVLEMAADPDRYAAMAERAFHHVEKTYGCDQQAVAIEAAVFGRGAIPTSLRNGGSIGEMVADIPSQDSAAVAGWYGRGWTSTGMPTRPSG